MARINLNKLTDKEIVEALMELRIDKFMGVTQALGDIMERTQKRGKLLGKRQSDVNIDDFINRLFEGEN